MILIKDRITISKAKKNKSLGYELIINYKNTKRNVIYSRSHNGKSRGIVGEIKNDCHFSNVNEICYHTQCDNIKSLLTSKIKQKIEFALEMIYGKYGSKDPVIVGKHLKIITSKDNEIKLLDFDK